MKTQNNIPALRFPEFDGEWEKTRLGKLIKIKSGNSPSSYVLNEEGTYPFIKVEELNNCIKYQNLSRFYSDEGKNLVEINSVIFPKRGAAILNNKVRINDCPILMDSNMMAITPNRNKLNHEFLYYKIFKEELFKIADTSTIPQINNKHIEPYLLSIPSLPEQNKIASFLSAVDEKIQQLTRKAALLEQYKKGIMQQLFSGELRFKDDDGKDFPEWKMRKLKELISEVVEKTTYSNQYQILSSTKNDIYLQSEYFTRDIASSDNTGYKILRINQLVFSPQNLWLGNINVNVKYEIGIVSPSYKVFNFIENVANISFLKDFMQTNRMMYEYAQASEQGASVVRRNLDMSSFMDIKFKLPCLKEQQKIASFLSGIDDKIASVNTQLEKTQTFKKGLLQQMFV